MGFKGKSVHAINESGRISIPARIRDELKASSSEEKLVIACLSNFIVAFPESAWQKFEEKLHETPPQSQKDADRLRMIYESLEDITIDKQGRILISSDNRAKAQLKDECVVLGLYDRVEIWSKENWEAKQMAALDGDAGEQFNLLMF